MPITVYQKIKAVYEIEGYKAAFYTILLAFLIIRLSYIKYGPLDLAPDEAHYWEWSRRLDFSYYSKGPIIAYLIALTTKLGGDNVFSVRLLSPFFSFLSSFLMYRLSTSMFGNSKAGILSGILLQITPLFSTYGILMTIDSPFVFFWCLALWLFWKTIATKKPFYWYVTGIVVGVGFLTKYTMLLFYFCVLIFLIFSKEDRLWLKRVHPYLAFMCTLLVCSPVIVWNAFHGWVTLLHTAYSHIRINEGLKFSLKSLFEFIASQIGIITPFLSSLIIYILIKYRHSDLRMSLEKKYLLSFSLPILLLVLLKSIQGKAEANWSLVSYPALFVLFSFYILERWKDFGIKLKLFIYFSLIFSFLFTVSAHYSSIFNIPPKLDPASRLKGWKELGIEISRIYDSMLEKGHVFVFSDSYQVSSELAFYIDGHPTTYNINLGRRMNQYDLWTDMNSEAIKIWQSREKSSRDTINGIFVRIGNENMPSEVAESFGKFEKRIFKVYGNNYLRREYSIFICYNFKGLKARKPETF